MVDWIMTEQPKPKRRWFRFSLRTLLIVVMLLSLPLAWLGIVAERTRRQKKILEPLEVYQPYVEWRSGYVVRLDLWSPYYDLLYQGGPSDEDLRHLKGLSNLEYLELGSANISNRIVSIVSDITTLRSLALRGRNITDDGLLHLERLTNLETLWLEETDVTDAGLVHLSRLSNLETLWLIGTDVSDTGVEELQETLHNCVIHTERP